MVELRRRTIESPIGPILAGVVEPGVTGLEPGGVCLLELGDEARRAREQHELEAHFRTVFMADSAAGGSRLLDELEQQLEAYFAGGRTEFTLPLCTPGTAFQHKVWTGMQEIPSGHTETYGGLARRLGLPSTSARAVGAASGRNRVSILIPCHRVVDGSYDPDAGGTQGLRGYGGGLENKRWLLEHERSLTQPTLMFP
jgi:O-6-methylguanine DNA methyltransferase